LEFTWEEVEMILKRVLKMCISNQNLHLLHLKWLLLVSHAGRHKKIDHMALNQPFVQRALSIKMVNALSLAQMVIKVRQKYAGQNVQLTGEMMEVIVQSQSTTNEDR